MNLKPLGDRVIVDTSNVVEGPPRSEHEGPSQAAGPSCLGEATPHGGGMPGAGEPSMQMDDHPSESMHMDDHASGAMSGDMSQPDTEMSP